MTGAVGRAPLWRERVVGRLVQYGMAPDRPIRLQEQTSAPIHIDCDVWIGRGCAILPGVTIGDGAVVGANSVVSRDVDPGTVVAGNPARYIRTRG